MLFLPCVWGPVVHPFPTRFVLQANPVRYFDLLRQKILKTSSYIFIPLFIYRQAVRVDEGIPRFALRGEEDMGKKESIDVTWMLLSEITARSAVRFWQKILPCSQLFLSLDWQKQEPPRNTQLSGHRSLSGAVREELTDRKTRTHAHTHTHTHTQR